jgi:hypothetical protein
MDIGLGFFLLTAGVIVVGAAVTTLYPNLLSKQTSDSLSAITVALIGILVSCAVLMIFLKANNREGFEEQSVVEKWKSAASEKKLEEICAIYNEIYEKILKVEKGSPEASVSDAQAREKTDERFSTRMKVNPIPCQKVSESLKENNMEGLFTKIQTLPDLLYVQAYETAIACRGLLIENYNRINEAESRRKEGFENICSDEEAKLQRQMKAEQKASKCVLPEDVPPEKKEDVIEAKLTKMASEWEKYTKANPKLESITKILEDCAYYKGELDKKAKAAEDMSNQYNW